MNICRLILICINVAAAVSLREVRIHTPIAVKKGDSTRLFCWFDTEGDPLYIVKWYKSGREFFRYVPQEVPAIKSFPFGSLKIQESESNATQVTLIHVDSDAAGIFTCEVSADAPSFQTAVVYGTMNVVELPPELPFISGLKSKYKINDFVILNCTSKNSRPAANLTWYINNKQVLQSLVRTYNNPKFDITIAQSGIQFQISENCFQNGKIKIKCSASIYDIYWQSTEVTVDEEKKKTFTNDVENIIDISNHQPPPNFQLGQKKLDGQIGVRVIGSNGLRNKSRLRNIAVCFFLLMILLLPIK